MQTFNEVKIKLLNYILLTVHPNKMIVFFTNLMHKLSYFNKFVIEYNQW